MHAMPNRGNLSAQALARPPQRACGAERAMAGSVPQAQRRLERQEVARQRRLAEAAEREQAVAAAGERAPRIPMRD